MKRPLNLAHRGAREQAPENTMPAFVQAMAMGADGVELDVHLSADGALVVIHDFTLEKTTNGHGLVSAHTLAELRQLDAGAWFGSAWVGTPIPTLDEVFESLPATAFVNIELKHNSPCSNGIERVACDFIQARALHSRIIVSSFDPLLLWRLRHLDASIPLGLLYDLSMPAGLRYGQFARWLRPQALHPHWRQLSPTTIPAAHAAGYRINTWTVNSAETMRQLIDWHVDAIITDVPDQLAALLA